MQCSLVTIINNCITLIFQKWKQQTNKWKHKTAGIPQTTTSRQQQEIKKLWEKTRKKRRNAQRPKLVTLIVLKTTCISLGLTFTTI